MNNVAQTRILRLGSGQQVLRLRSGQALLSANYVLPSMLVFNTAALLALDALGGIPAWVKTAAALFLSF